MKKKLIDEPVVLQIKDTLELPWTVERYLNLKLGCDELPNGQGEFGTVNNPIPVNGAPGVRAYLNRLQTNDGKSLSFKRVRSTSCKVLDTRVDEYEIKTADGSAQAVLVFDIYNLWRSTKAPEGFILKPISELFDDEIDALKTEFQKPTLK